MSDKASSDLQLQAVGRVGVWLHVGRLVRAVMAWGPSIIETEV